MNIATETMNKMTNMLRNSDAKLKNMGREPYGTRKATAQEQMELYQNLTEAQLYEMIQKHGIDTVNKWLYRMEQRSR
jgi:hypothetical protein